MLAKKLRLFSNSVKYTLAKGSRFSTKLFIVKIFRHPKLNLNRFAVIVSTKISGKATVRNRLRRQIYESIRLGLGNIATNNNVVLIVKKNILEAEFKEIQKEITLILSKLNT